LLAIARGPTGKGLPKPDSTQKNPRGSIGQKAYSPRAPLGLQFENSTEAIRVCQSRDSESGCDLQGGNHKKLGSRSFKGREKSGNPYPPENLIEWLRVPDIEKEFKLDQNGQIRVRLKKLKIQNLKRQ
jgi:hypothetical protein